MLSNVIAPALDLGTLVILLLIARTLWSNGKGTTKEIGEVFRRLHELQTGVSEAKTKAEKMPDVPAEVERLKQSLEALQLRFTTLVEEMEERSRYATATWRKISAAEKRIRGGDEDEEEWGEFSERDAERGGQETMFSMSTDMEAEPDPLQEARRAIIAARKGAR